MPKKPVRKLKKTPNMTVKRGLLTVAIVAVVGVLVWRASHAGVVSPTYSSLALKQGLIRPIGGVCQAGGLFQVKGTNLCTHGPDIFSRQTSVGVSAATTFPSSGFPCDGDGTTGKRVQALYMYSGTSRFNDLTDTFRSGANAVNQIFMRSAAKDGAGRLVRFVTDPSCNLSVIPVSVSSTQDFSAMVQTAAAQGYNRTDRLYLMWVDGEGTFGLGNMDDDDRAGLVNINNTGGRYAAAWKGVWGGGVLAHELGHALGAVQSTAPHHSLSHHCTDEFDLMCYDDSYQHPELPPNHMTKPCTNEADDFILDCGSDDYYNAGTVPVGTWLATHWNVAGSPFLIVTKPYPQIHLGVKLGPGHADLTWSQQTGSIPLVGYDVYRFDASSAAVFTGDSQPKLLGSTQSTSYSDNTIEVGPQGVPQPFHYAFTYFIVGRTMDGFRTKSADAVLATSGLITSASGDNTATIDCNTKRIDSNRKGNLVSHLEFTGFTATLGFYDCLSAVALPTKTGPSPLNFTYPSPYDIVLLTPLVTSDKAGAGYYLTVEYPLEDRFDNSRN